MTTLQLLLDAVQHVCEDLELRPEARRLSKLVANDADMVGEDENEIFKLWPTTSDRDAFKHAMDNGLAIEGFERSRTVQAHEFFQLQVKEWLNSDPGLMQLRAEALETTISEMLQIVVIDLNSQDDPHVIFETLNARGTPLLESELIKNYVLSRAGQVSANGIWGDLDDGWWRQQVTQGRLRRPRIDMMFNYWLAMRTIDEVPASRVFNVFRSHTTDLSIDDVMSDVRRDLGNYRRFDTGTRNEDEEDFHYRTQVMQARAITPAILFLLSSPTEKRVKALRALESFFIRRMARRGTTKDYNRLTLELVGELQKHGIDDVDSVVVKFLRDQTADSRVWPDDQDLEEALVTLPLYRILTRGRLRLILEGVEERLRKSSKAEQSDAPKNLSIEHVMPISWGASWSLPIFMEEDERVIQTNARNRIIHTIGNLTLTTQRLNSTLSNAAWESKRETLGKHSVLHLNKVLLDESSDSDWDEGFIQARSQRMAKLVAEVWPGPDSSVWD